MRPRPPWSPGDSNIDNRNNALEALRAVLRAAPDLDAYVVRLDKQAAETREENPILRKAIGQVYREKEQFGKAIEQLLIAAEVQPNDAETYQALLACYDRQNDQQGAVEQLLAWRQLAPRDIKLYEDLGKRLEKLGQAAEVERAYTSIVEVAARRVGKPSASGGDSPAARPLGRRGRSMAAGRADPFTGADRPARPGRGLDPPAAIRGSGRSPDATQAEELAGAIRELADKSPWEDLRVGAKAGAGPEGEVAAGLCHKRTQRSQNGTRPANQLRQLPLPDQEVHIHRQ